MVQPLTAKQVHESLRSDDDAVIIDVLPKGYFKKQHLPKAINIPEEEVPEIVEKLFEKNRKLILYCYDTQCPKSLEAAKQLEELGYGKIYDLEEGIEGYKQAGYEIHRI